MEEEEALPQKTKTNLNSDWKNVKFLNWMGVLLGSAPPYDFQMQKFDNLHVYRYYAIIIIFLTIIGYIHGVVGRSYTVYPYMNLSVTVMDFICTTCWTLFNILVAGLSAFRTRLSDELFGSLVKNDMFLHPKHRKEKSAEEGNLKLYVGLLHFIFFLLIVYDTYVWVMFGDGVLKFYFFKNFQHYIPIFVVIRIGEVLKFIKIRFTSSVEILIDLANEIHKFPTENEQIDDELKRTRWIRVSQRIKPRQEDIMQLKLLTKIFDTLFDSVGLFNEMFSCQVFLLIFSAILELFQGINFLVAFCSGSLSEPRLADGSFAVLRASWTLLFLVLGMSLVHQAACVKRQSYLLAKHINRRLLDMPFEELLRDEAQEELTNLRQQLIKRPLHVDGLFFSPDYAFAADILFFITSFCPVIIQFNRI